MSSRMSSPRGASRRSSRSTSRSSTPSQLRISRPSSRQGSRPQTPLGAGNIFCELRKYGCRWSGKNVEMHLGSCAYTPCPHRKHGCEKLGRPTEQKRHENVCAYQPTVCPYRCPSTVLRKDIEEHVMMCEIGAEARQVENEMKAQNAAQAQAQRAAREAEAKREEEATSLRMRHIEQTAKKLAGLKPLRVNVGGREFTTTFASLNRYPNSLLGVLAQNYMQAGAQDPLFIDRNPDIFSCVLDFLRSGELPQTSNGQRRMLELEAEYLDIPQLKQALATASPTVLYRVNFPGFWAVYSSKRDAENNIRFTFADMCEIHLAALNLSDGWFWNSNFAGMNLRDTKFNNADVHDANFERADLSNADLSGADLHAANLKRANLRGANLTGANVDKAVLPVDLTYVNFSNVDFKERDMSGLNLRLATLKGTNLSKCVLINTTLPMDMQGVILSGCDLQARDLSESKLQNADLSGASLNYIKLPSDLSGVNFTGCDLKDRDLKGFNFSGCNLTNVNFSGSELTGANLSGATLLGAILPVDLTEINFSDVDLKDRDFKTGNLAKCNFSNANLAGAILKDANLSEAVLTGATLPEGLSGVNLSGVDLSDRDLANADLSNSSLYNATLSGSNLSGANLRGSNVTGAVIGYRSTTLPQAAFDRFGSNLHLANNMTQIYYSAPSKSGRFGAVLCTPAFKFSIKVVNAASSIMVGFSAGVDIKLEGGANYQSSSTYMLNMANGTVYGAGKLNVPYTSGVFVTGTVVTCSWNPEDRTISFAINGVDKGVAYKGVATAALLPFVDFGEADSCVELVTNP